MLDECMVLEASGQMTGRLTRSVCSRGTLDHKRVGTWKHGTIICCRIRDTLHCIPRRHRQPAAAAPVCGTVHCWVPLPTMEKKLLFVVQGWVYAEEQLLGPAAPVAPQLVKLNGELKLYSGVPTLQKLAHALVCGRATQVQAARGPRTRLDWYLQASVMLRGRQGLAPVQTLQAMHTLTLLNISGLAKNQTASRRMHLSAAQVLAQAQAMWLG